MKIFDGKNYRDATPEELQAFETALEEQLAEEQTRNLTADEVVRIVMSSVLKTAQDVPEEPRSAWSATIQSGGQAQHTARMTACSTQERCIVACRITQRRQTGRRQTRLAYGRKF